MHSATNCGLACDKVRMVTALSQLHHSVHQVGNIRRRSASCQEREVALENRTIILLLDVRQLHLGVVQLKRYGTARKSLFKLKAFLNEYIKV